MTQPPAPIARRGCKMARAHFGYELALWRRLVDRFFLEGVFGRGDEAPALTPVGDFPVDPGAVATPCTLIVSSKLLGSATFPHMKHSCPGRTVVFAGSHAGQLM